MHLPLLLVALILAGALYSEDTPKTLTAPTKKEVVRKKRQETPESVLMESYQLSKSLSLSDRAVLLNFVSLTAGTHRLARTSGWAQENLLVARQMPMEWNRLAIEKNAVMALSYVNPARAMTMLRNLDLPIPERDSFVEDLRSDGADTVFRNYWRSREPKGIPEIRSTAAFLGQTGQYPYMAVQNIVLDLAALAAKEQEQLPIPAQSLVSDAYSFYQRGSKFEIEDDEFVEFLKTLKLALSPGVLRQGLEMAVDRLLDPDRLHPQQSYLAHVQTAKGSATFQHRQEMLLFQLLPMIREIDPDWAIQVIHRDPALAQAEGNSGKEIASEGVVSPGSTKPISEQSPALQRSRAAAAGEMAQANPEGAMQLAQTITDPSIRAVALANVSAVIGSSSPRQAKDIEKTINDSVGGLKDGENKLEVLSALARVSASAGDISAFRKILEKCFDLGEDLFEELAKAHTDTPIYTAQPYNILSDLIKSSTSLDPVTMTFQVEQTRNVALKAYLLQSLADALFTKSGVQQSPR